MNAHSVVAPKENILIVDDNPENLRLLSTLLAKKGYNVRRSLNGETALSAVHAIVPDLVLLDINMPGMSGYEVCEHLKNNPQTREIPVIFLSAWDDVQYKIKAFKVGGVDYITKPFQFEEVLARIQHQLTIQHLQTQIQAQNKQLQQTLTELKKTQAQLVQKEKMVSLGQLAAGMAHEINNPISFISGNLAPAREYVQDLLGIIDLYRQEYPDPTPRIKTAIAKIDLDFITSDLQRLMISMQNGVERIGSTILALRIFSRLNESDIKTVDLHEGIDSTLLLLRERLKQNQNHPEIKTIKNYADLPFVTCYASQINQVFLNLLNNAIDALEEVYTNTDSPLAIPTIWITTEYSPTDSVIIRIKDNGVGIPDELQLRLFDPFFTTKPVGSGSGLGLSTSYEIVVQKHKGKLTCFSSPGKGAEFVIEIPVFLGKS
jgi:signal transduction histidine kinase